MRKILLIGNEGRRKDFFIKAGNDKGKNVEFLPLFSDEVFSIKDPLAYSVKIDPPVYESGDYSILEDQVEKYEAYLKKLSEMNFNFLNSPYSLINTLDKFKMKEILLKNKLATTEEIKLEEYTFISLLESLRKERLSNIFIKPRYGSGAVGIIALKYNFKLNDIVIFTSLMKSASNYYNTKKLRRIRDKDLIEDLVSRVLEDRPLVEKWIEKKRYKSKPFDLRVIVEFGKVLYILARSSDGPITNLHLNNGAIEIEEVNLREDLLREVEKISIEAVASFKGLNSAGVDVLISKNNLIKIIEVNGHGDLLYKDIFSSNSIYKNQIERM